MMKPLLVIGALLALSACGGRVALKPQAGGTMPSTPETAAREPTADELLAPDIQSRPKRSDEQLRRSEERQEDRFDLPPAS